MARSDSTAPREEVGPQIAFGVDRRGQIEPMEERTPGSGVSDADEDVEDALFEFLFDEEPEHAQPEAPARP